MAAYGEGIGKLPKASDTVNAANASGNNSGALNTVQKQIKLKRFFYAIPTSVLDNKLLSDTSDAKDCFIKRNNSRLLQKHLLSYAVTLSKSYNLST